MTIHRVATSLRYVVVPASAAVLALMLSACCKSGDGDACPARYRELTADKQVGESSCSCAAGSATGSVWGTDIYTTDSSICAAAVHAGVIASSGGTVKLKNAPGCPAYVGTARNGVPSGSWGPYQGSFYFPDKGDGKCSEAAPATAPPVATGNTCPTRFKDVPGLSATTTITCTCNAGASAGPLWGTDTYTQDSAICKAAVHAGVIPPSGGTVTAKAAAGCKTYSATTRNGVSSSKWGSYDASFYFPSKSSGTCL